MSASTAENNDNDYNNKDDIQIPDVCANCGKGEEDSVSLKACTACKLVKYCNRECQIAHRPQHKKQCKKRAAELHDEELFKQPPSQFEDCPICCLQMPVLDTGSRYYTCCGKTICCGCIHAPRYDNRGNEVDNQYCPFCRTSHPKTYEEITKQDEKRMDAGDVIAIYNRGCEFDSGECGLPQDNAKAMELWHNAGELGYSLAYYNIGCAYDTGDGVEIDKKKAKHYYELAAMQGHVKARHMLGNIEGQAGNYDRAFRHYMIAVRDGGKESLDTIRKMLSFGHSTKDNYMKALISYQAYLDEIKSDQRDEAAAADDKYKYIE